MNYSPLTSHQILTNIWQCIRKNDFSQAITLSSQLTQTFPEFAPGWHVASQLAQKTNQPDMALFAFEKALQLEPANRDWQLQYAACLVWRGDTEPAMQVVNQLHSEITAVDPPNPEHLVHLSYLYRRLEMFDVEKTLYRKLIELQPQSPGHWYNQGVVQRFCGEITEAESSLTRAIELSGELYSAHALRSDLRKQTAQSNHIPEMEQMLHKGIKSHQGQFQICHALAKELEDIGEFNRSFSALQQGASVRRKGLNYDPDSDLQTMQAIEQIYNTELFDGRIQGHPDKAPIFIIGLPRTGTTLVERILSGHSNVFAAGELKNFNVQMMKQIAFLSGNQQLSGSTLVRKTTELNFQSLGESYVASTRPQTGQHPHFIDKAPLNFLFAGLIHLALPNAKIINLIRHPMDTCYAIYKRLFWNAYPWSYDLIEIADYYLAYRQLMSHWLNVMPGVIHEVAYEDVVADIDTEARKLVSYCALDWESGCTHFHENKSASTTASATQVRQPLYRSSVGRWKDYEQQLAPVRDRLREGGIMVD